MGFLDFLFGKKKDNTTTHYGFVSNEDGKGMTHEEALNLQTDLLKQLELGNSAKAINAAATMMMKKMYNEAIAAYQHIAEKFPKEKGTAHGQIGAAHFFKGDYEKAIEYYVSARSNGEHAGMMDDNIWEACETLYKQSQDKKWANKYLELCPEGAYKKQANELL
jgi:tetratricopeptide (TPR) repeat protein